MSTNRSASLRSILSALAVFGAISAYSHSAAAGLVNPTDPALAPFTLTYGDFNIVSLQFADTALSTNAYYVASSPGQIRPDVVVATGAGGSFANDGVTFTQMDTPYATPSGHGAAFYFQTGNATSAPDPGGAGQFPGDTANTWDASLSQLKSALAGGSAVFYFNLNETGVNGALSGTDLLAWGKATLISLTDPNLDPMSFYLAGNPLDPAGGGNGKALSIATGGPDPTIAPTDVPADSVDYPSDPKWTYIHGNICVNGSTFLHYGSCVAGDPAGSTSVNQNLGANQAAFAAYNLTLDNLINNPCVIDKIGGLGCYSTLQIDFRMTGLDNGFEQVFLASTAVPQGVPEPASLTLLGAGLLALSLIRRNVARRIKIRR